ncbi:mannose-6-phosphate isomerase [Mycoplasma testudineum]|uniref:Mannose-6-phosphate isomerase n=1 Tax=Mycoplasma testudineum TaxID=244584 RepID=A0A4R6IFH7_9MOLU|nr:type I phosphomannose isomerase catalytic subunit [Mycoplasma testudineum]OYD26989.1 mannose-6-phosphate isomerase [Mycoplasma testudineum]TDO20536.1 mannose-6-phosphate isomerase [Mycoplasma testudineum]
MKKIKPIILKKIWGREIWLHSPLVENQSIDENGNKITTGPLIKIIEANQALSIQVHPDNEKAKLLENMANGKSESWYILKAEEGAKIIVGLLPGISEKDIAIANQNNYKKLFNLKSIKDNQFYDIPAGYIHAIGNEENKFIQILEVQQPSDITYRVYDYERKDSNGNYRDLHIDKAIKSVKTNLNPLEIQKVAEYQDIKNEYFVQKLISDKDYVFEQNGYAIVKENDEFICYLVNKNEKNSINAFYFIYSRI